MAKTPRASPGVGRDTKTNGPSPDAILKALATEVLDQEGMKLLRERRKKNRKRAEGDSVNLAQLDRLYAMRDSTEGEVEEFFRSAWLHMTSLFNGLAEQLDIFSPKAPRERKAAFAHLGQMSGLKGEPDTPPPNLDGDEAQQWLQGYQRGSEARSGAQKALADTLAAALATEPGTVLDGKTGKPLTKAQQKAADASAAKAAADAKQPDLEAQAKAPEAGGEGSSIKLADQPDWSAYDDDPIKWAPEQSRAFRAWFDALPAGASVQIAHAGIRKAFAAARGDGVTAADVIGVVEEIIQEGLDAKIGGDTFEASPEEIAAQAGRKGGATDIDDPLVVDGIRHANKTRANEARRLKASQSEQAAAKRAEAGVP